MEIADYLKVARQRLWILIVVPVLAAGAALAYGLSSPTTYSATATVLSPSLVGTPYSQFNGPQATAQFVSAFTASAADPTVIAQTAKDTGANGSDLTSNVTIAQVGASSNVTLTYSGLKQTTPRPIAQALANNALKNIYTAQGKVADIQVNSASKVLDAANKAISAYVVKVGVADPVAAYQAAVGKLAWLEQAQAVYTAEVKTFSATAMKGPVADAKKQVSTIGATLPEYSALLSAQKVATASYQSVLSDQRKAQAQSAAAADPAVIQTDDASPNVASASVIKFVIPVFGAAVLLAIILIALIEFIAAVRRQPSVKVVTRSGQLAVPDQERIPSNVGA